jgi:putative DNA primase/helicase
VDAKTPTLLIDEADAFLVKNDELRAILNSGHRRGSALVLRVEGENFETREFATFAAAAITCIGSLPETLEDRSIHVNLKRRRSDEKIESLDLNNVDHLTDLASKAVRWVSDHLAELKAAHPKVPAKLLNREADNWRPLLAVADAAGGKWPDGMRRIAEQMSVSARKDEVSAKVLLLRDIRAAFAEDKVERMSSARLVKTLIEMEGHPWCEWKGSQPFTQNALARLLRDFEIYPVELRIDLQVLRGYRIEQFADAFRRYVEVS